MRPTVGFPNEAPPRSYISFGPLLATCSRGPWKQSVGTMGVAGEYCYKIQNTTGSDGGRYEREEKRDC